MSLNSTFADMQQKPFQSVLLLAILAFTWGSSFILMKLGLEAPDGSPVFSPYQVAAMRMSFAFWVMLPFAVYYLPRIPKENFLPLILVGMCGNAIPAFMFTTAEMHLAPSLAGMLNSTTPLFTVIIAALVFKNKFSRANYLGLALGIAGSAGLMLSRGTDEFYGEAAYAGLILIATFCYAISVNTIRNYLTGIHPLGVTSVSFFFFGVPLSIYLFTTDFVSIAQTHPHGYSSLGYIVLLAVFGTAIAVILFNYLVRITSAVYASTVTYLIPITAIFWGFMRSEVINIWHFLFMSVILTGVYLINRKG